MDLIETILNILKKIFFINDDKTKEHLNNRDKTEVYNNFHKKDYILTTTELKFYKILKSITDELNLVICPQVALYEIVATDNLTNFNKISNKTIDFVVTEPNLRIKCCFELDDYTHNQTKRIERDIFLNQLFFETGIKLYRIKVSQYYDKDKIKNMIMGL